jgi:hypothetical protein
LVALVRRLAFIPCQRASFAAAQFITKRVCGGALWTRHRSHIPFLMMRARPCPAHAMHIQVGLPL